jgi:hypothetical protein
MTTRSFRATLLLSLPLLLFLPQCKPKDPTPPVTKATSAPSIPTPTSQTGVVPGCVGLGCEKKECIGLGCGDSTPKCVGMGCEKESAHRTPARKE